jgi:hypothetical protein
MSKYTTDAKGVLLQTEEVVARPKGFEPPTSSSGGRRSIR